MRLFLFGTIFLANALTSHAQITVAAASDMQSALPEIVTGFTQESKIDVKTVFGSSGKLATQIKAGAPFDLFISANMAYPESLYVWGQAQDKPKLCAYGVLVLWTLGNLDVTKGLPVLKDSKISKIGLPDPQHAPYGIAAVQAMKKAGVYDSVQGKLVFAENISQSAQYIASGSVDIGFNSKAIVLGPQLVGKGKWVEVDSSLYDPLAQGVALCKYGKENHFADSKKFMNYLFSEKSRGILLRYGFKLPKNNLAMK